MPISPANINGYDFNSNAEKEIYLSALESGYFDNPYRYFFHSLNMAKTGNSKIKAEIDFVYLDNECILFLEVKGGHVKYNSLTNEWWVLGGTQKGDPFKQAYDALFQTRNNLLPELFKNETPRRLIYGIGVLFPECLKPTEFVKERQGKMEFEPELIFDYNDYKQKKLISYILKVKKYWAEHPQFKNRTGISNKELLTISNYFRQTLFFKLPVSHLLKKEDSELITFTARQMFVLDSIEINPKKAAIIMGGPGTGKTILALELLKRKLEKGEKVLFVCYNKNLAEYLKKEAEGFEGKGFEIRNIHDLYFDSNYLQSPIKTPADDFSKFWSQDLPLLFIRKVSEGKKGYFDYIIIDEGQDILNEYHFDALSVLLKGGCESGNWAMFLDKDFQNIYNLQADDYFTYMREVYPNYVHLLQVNCRNTISTIERACIETGFPKMECWRKDDYWKSEIKYYASNTDLMNKINDVITKMQSDGIENKYITILCFDKFRITNLKNSNLKRFTESAFEVSGKINVSTIHSYKGLENKFILICGPQNYDPNDKQQMSLIYIANTRATAQSIFFLDEKYNDIIINRITEKITTND